MRSSFVVLAVTLVATLGWTVALAREAARAAPPQVSVGTVDAPVAEVWKVLSTAEGWKALGVAKAQVDFRVGGKIRTHYDPKGTIGDEKTIENTILAYEPYRMLAIRATGIPAGFPFPRETIDRVWTVLTLVPLGDGRTRITLRGQGYADDEASRKMRAWFQKGNDWTMRHLEEHFASGAASALAPIECSTAIAADPGEVFHAFTTSEGVKGTLGIGSEIELTVGGPYELYFDKSRREGERGSEGCEVLSWLPDRMFSFTWNAPPQFPYARQRRTIVVVEFEVEAPGWTRVRLTQFGFDRRAREDPTHADEWASVRTYFVKAWPSVLESMKNHFPR